MDISVKCGKCVKLVTCFAVRKLTEAINEMEDTTVIFAQPDDDQMCRREMLSILAANCIQYEPKKEKWA